MFGSTILEIALGVVFIYLILSLVCSAINEWVASMTRMRAKTLEAGIQNLLNDQDLSTHPELKNANLAKLANLSDKVYNHPMVCGLYREGARPSYIPSQSFAMALMDVLAPATSGAPALSSEALVSTQKLAPAPIPAGAAPEAGRKHARGISTSSAEGGQPSAASEAAVPGGIANALRAVDSLEAGTLAGMERVQQLKDTVSQLPDDSPIKKPILLFISQAENDVTKAENLLPEVQKHIESWFDAGMTRVSGWYKRWSQLVTVTAALGITIVFNADTISMIQRINHDSALRASLVAASQNAGKTAGAVELAMIKKELDGLNLPVGWPAPEAPSPGREPGQYAWFLVQKLVGLLLTAAAISLGAPFWFDTLKKIISIRGSGQNPLESRKASPQPAGG